MARHGIVLPPPADADAGATTAPRSDWGTLARLFPYLWRYRWRVVIALSFMVTAKVANVSVPLLLNNDVDKRSRP